MSENNDLPDTFLKVAMTVCVIVATCCILALALTWGRAACVVGGFDTCTAVVYRCDK